MNLPDEVTILYSVRVPGLPYQKTKFLMARKIDKAGATAFFSGARTFSLLTPEEQGFTLNTTVTYAPQAYEYIRHRKGSEDGLTIPCWGRETVTDQLSAWTWANVAEHPLTTRKPETGDATVIDDAEKVHKIVYNLQKRFMLPYISMRTATRKEIWLFLGVMDSIAG